jgi:two-component system, sensor histidine kinase and response regulator
MLCACTPGETGLTSEPLAHTERDFVKILVVDDERALAALMGRALTRMGHTPELAYHPGDALAVFDDTFDAVITDIDMPDMSGIELARAIRAVAPDMPIAFCTGSDPGNRNMREAALLGPVMGKQWTPTDLDELLRRMLPAAPAGRRRAPTSPDPVS